MCRNIRTLYNFEPEATDDEVRAASLQYVRKISGFNKPSQVNQEAFEQAVEEIAALGPQALAVPTDVRNPDQCKAMVEATVAHFGKLDILINNAGGAHGHVGLHRMDLAKWDRDIQLNLSAEQYCAQAAIPHLKRSKGTIVNVYVARDVDFSAVMR